mmetsp:Transcript_28446/g.71046  ORF Transcript_28446/g.71046 Transcript_28446/m.71046 type:complete len:158 (+) Transcript_28446:996-1469(+)
MHHHTTMMPVSHQRSAPSVCLCLVFMRAKAAVQPAVTRITPHHAILQREICLAASHPSRVEQAGKQSTRDGPRDGKRSLGPSPTHSLDSEHVRSSTDMQTCTRSRHLKIPPSQPYLVQNPHANTPARQQTALSPHQVHTHTFTEWTLPALTFVMRAL